jgi:hypothetical protein
MREVCRGTYCATLVKHDYRSKRGLRISQETMIFAGHENFVQAEETLANACVERRVLLEPLVGLSLLEPELQDISNPPIFEIVNDCGTLQ